MIIEDVFYQLLKGDATLVAFRAGRLFLGAAKPEVEPPYQVYRASSGRQIIETLEGGVALTRQRMLVVSAAKKATDAADMDEATIHRLNEFSGVVTLPGTSPVESITVQGIFLAPLAHDGDYDDRSGLHEYASEFVCHYLDPRRL